MQVIVPAHIATARESRQLIRRTGESRAPRAESRRVLPSARPSIKTRHPEPTRLTPAKLQATPRWQYPSGEESVLRSRILRIGESQFVCPIGAMKACLSHFHPAYWPRAYVPGCIGRAPHQPDRDRRCPVLPLGSLAVSGVVLVQHRRDLRRSYGYAVSGSGGAATWLRWLLPQEAQVQSTGPGSGNSAEVTVSWRRMPSLLRSNRKLFRSPQPAQGS
jgi:hypothetical protein